MKKRIRDLESIRYIYVINIDRKINHIGDKIYFGFNNIDDLFTLLHRIIHLLT